MHRVNHQYYLHYSYSLQDDWAVRSLVALQVLQAEEVRKRMGSRFGEQQVRRPWMGDQKVGHWQES